MADIYSRMQDTARRLLSPTSQGGLGQGNIVLTRVTSSGASANPWDPVTPTTVKETLNGAVRGVGSELIGTEVGGTVILASDRVAICAIPKMAYQAGDVLSIDGTPVNILSVQNLPAAGVAAAVRFIVRG